MITPNIESTLPSLCGVVPSFSWLVVVAGMMCPGPLGAAPLEPRTRVSSLDDGKPAVHPSVSVTGDGFALVSWPTNDSVQLYLPSGDRVHPEPIELGHSWAVYSQYSLLESLLITRLFMRTDDFGSGVHVEFLDPSGNVVHPGFLVNEHEAGTEFPIAIEGLRDGGFVALWKGDRGLSARSFAYDDAALDFFAVSPEIVIDEHGAGHAAIAAQQDGGFVVSWTQRSTNYTPALQSFGHDGRAKTERLVPCVVNCMLSFAASVDVDASGRVVVVWPSFDESEANYQITARLYDERGASISTPIAITEEPIALAGRPDVAKAPGGNFVVVWGQQSGPDVPDGATWRREFGPLGRPLGPALMLNDPEDGVGLRDYQPVELDDDGNYTVVWSQVADGGDAELYLQRFQSPGAEAFTLLASDQVCGVPSTDRGGWRMYAVDVPEGSETLRAQIGGGTGDADLYLRRGLPPTATSWDGASWNANNHETVVIEGSVGGRWFVGVHAYSEFEGLEIFVEDGAPSGPTADLDESSYTGLLGSPLRFDARGSSTPDGAALSYIWDTGDGTEGHPDFPVLEHAFETRGEFGVSVTVVDAEGNRHTVSATASIHGFEVLIPPLNILL